MWGEYSNIWSAVVENCQAWRETAMKYKWEEAIEQCTQCDSYNFHKEINEKELLLVGHKNKNITM